MQTINISHHAPALAGMSERHRISVTEVIDRIIRHGIDREYHLFDWSPRPGGEATARPAETETSVPEPFPETRERRSA